MPLSPSELAAKLARLNEFLNYTSRIKFVNVNLEKTVNKYTLDVEVAENLKPLSVERLNLVQDLLGYSDIFDYIKIRIPSEPFRINVNTDGAEVPINPIEQYTMIVDDTINEFFLKIPGLNNVKITNTWVATDFAQCKVTIDSTNSQISASKYDVYVTENTQLSTVNNDIFTFYYVNTGSLILGFTPGNKQYIDSSYYPSYYGASQGTYIAKDEVEKMTLRVLDPFGYNSFNF